MREELGIGESGLHRVVNGAFGLLHLIAFFTAGEDKPAQSWHLRQGLTAWHAAGQIHSDIQKGFVRAEVIGWDALVEAGGYAGARDRGTLRLEGRDYLMTDGDVLTSSSRRERVQRWPAPATPAAADGSPAAATVVRAARSRRRPFVARAGPDRRSSAARLDRDAGRGRCVDR